MALEQGLMEQIKDYCTCGSLRSHLPSQNHLFPSCYHLEGYTDQTIGPFSLELGQKLQKDIYLEASQ